ncbi:hypothetical protein C0992_006747 [Termitomyces sp. T32_za158]|nr:hypothetical protein C0992_006747 [Termitomyces sp. T32_za158]
MSGFSLRLASSNIPRCSLTILRSRVSRSIHTRRSLPYPIEGGLGKFLPPEALKVVAVDYQEGLLKRLNEEVRGSPEAAETIAQTVINTATREQGTLAFNYASLALNNDYFLDQLRPPPTEGESKNHQNKIGQHLATSIRNQYGTLVQLKSAFSSAVMGMFTSGWVWFVTDRSGRLGIIPTFGPGTLLIRSRSYMGYNDDDKAVLGSTLLQQDSTIPYEHDGWDAYTTNASVEEIDMDFEDDTRPLRSPTGSPTSHTSPYPSSPVSGVTGGRQPPVSPNALHPRFLSSTISRTDDFLAKKRSSVYSVSTSDTSSRPKPNRDTSDLLQLGETLYPLFCVSVYEHAWMAAGYGVWGKEAWLKEFWTVLDWEKVSKAYAKVYPDRTTS